MHSKQKALFIDHACHLTTQSSYFFKKILETDFDTTIHSYSKFYKCNLTPEILSAHDYFIFFEFMYGRFRLCPNNTRSIYVPMYDNEWESKWRWRRISSYNMPVISFCSRISEFARKHGVSKLLDVRFFPDPSLYQNMAGDPEILLLWERGSISFTTIKKMFNPGDFKKIMILRRSEEGVAHEQISAEDIKTYNIEITETKFLPKEEFLRTIEPAGTIIAPRLKEGIGMAFLESMAMRKCVIAHKDATMDEYIEHGKNGILFNALKPDKISIEFIKKTHANIPDPTPYYEKWLKGKSQINSFISQCPKSSLSTCKRLKDILMYFAFIIEALTYRFITKNFT